MKQTGIIMSGNHPTKVLDGTKTMTRRTWGLETVNRNPGEYQLINFDSATGIADFTRGPHNIGGINVAVVYHCKCSYGGVGDLLWMKETYLITGGRGSEYIAYKADGYALAKGLFPEKWRPSIFMPRDFSRADLLITELRAERLQDITDNDCQAEGCLYPQWHGSHTSWKGSYKALWDSLNGKEYPWSMNLWVWVISFKLRNSSIK